MTLIVRGVDLERFEIIAQSKEKDGLHILVRDRQGDHRLIWSDALKSKQNEILVPFNRRLPMQAAAAVRFWRYFEGQASRPLPQGYRLTIGQRRRMALALRHWDGKRAGASQSKIAEIIYSTKLTRGVWSDSSERAQSRRLQKLASKLIGGGYRKLINPFLP